MDLKIPVYLLTPDLQTERNVRAALGPEHRFELGRTCRQVEELDALLERQPASLVIVDVDPDPVERVFQLSALVDTHTHSRFVILTSDMSAQLVLRAMQVGVRHVQARESISAELPGVLRDLAPDSQLGIGARGGVLTVFSSSGGCGATTLAVNVANEVQLSMEQDVLVIDLDYHYGAVANYLELRNAYGIAEVLSHRDGVDYQLIRSTAVHYSERLHALLSPASIHGAAVPSLRTDRLEQALMACRQAYALTVVDAPRVSIEVAATLANGSDTCWIVLQPTVKDIRTAKALYAGLVSRGVAPDAIQTIMNRYQKRHQMISFEETQKALGGMSIRRLSNDYASAIRGVNYGQPLSHAAPRSALRRDLLELSGPLAAQLSSQLVAKHDPAGAVPQYSSHNGRKVGRS